MPGCRRLQRPVRDDARRGAGQEAAEDFDGDDEPVDDADPEPLADPDPEPLADPDPDPDADPEPPERESVR